MLKESRRLLNIYRHESWVRHEVKVKLPHKRSLSDSSLDTSMYQGINKGRSRPHKTVDPPLLHTQCI